MTKANHADEHRLRFNRHCPATHVPIEYPPLRLCPGVKLAGYAGRFNDPVAFLDGAACGVAFGLQDFLLLQNGTASQHVGLILLALHQRSTSTRTTPTYAKDIALRRDLTGNVVIAWLSRTVPDRGD